MPQMVEPEPHPYPSLAIVGSRRLPGPNLYSSRAGAVLEVELSGAAGDNLLPAWERAVRHLLQRLGWRAEHVVILRHATGAGLFLSAPVDGLLAATEIAEQAWLMAEAPLDDAGVTDAVQRLRVFIGHDRRPRIVSLASAAQARGLTFSQDDEYVSVGSGTGVRRWRLSDVPDVRDVPWDGVHDVPTALVTGSNGKTTTTRLMAAMLTRAGHTTGWCCTSGVYVGGACVAEGDYSGPTGARLVIHDTRVTAAVLEAARGGMLRRGLAVDHARVAVVTNVSEDHFGEYGISDLPSLGAVKLVVARALRPGGGGRLVLNADDPTLRALAPGIAAPITWYAIDPDNAFLPEHVAAGGEALAWDCDELVAWRGGERQVLAAVAAVPIGLGGHARYNIANALAASAAALAMGVTPDDIRATLVAFGAELAHNPGRLALFQRAGVTIVVDFVHNPDGWRALGSSLRHVRATRRVVMLGQAGDRDSAALALLAQSAWALNPAAIVLKELPRYLRGKAPGETTAALAREFVALGASPDSVRIEPTERDAIAATLQLSAPGDLVFLAVHEDFDAAVRQLELAGAVRLSSLPA